VTLCFSCDFADLDAIGSIVPQLVFAKHDVINTVPGESPAERLPEAPDSVRFDPERRRVTADPRF